MKRRQFILSLFAAGVGARAVLSSTSTSATTRLPAIGSPPVPLNKSKAEWKTLISADRYDVLFEEATERPRSSPLNTEKRDGTFVCAACNLPLFKSTHKYESGTGWPSFFDVIAGAVATKKDLKHIFPRTEYHCARCRGHQGHVFDDGPAPTRLRYCNNGLALLFVAADTPLPALRS